MLSLDTAWYKLEVHGSCSYLEESILLLTGLAVAVQSHTVFQHGEHLSTRPPPHQGISAGSCFPSGLSGLLTRSSPLDFQWSLSFLFSCILGRLFESSSSAGYSFGISGPSPGPQIAQCSFHTSTILGSVALISFANICFIDGSVFSNSSFRMPSAISCSADAMWF